MLRAALSACRGQTSTWSSSKEAVLALSREEWPRGMWGFKGCKQSAQEFPSQALTLHSSPALVGSSPSLERKCSDN